MATKTSYIKGGTVVECSTSVEPRPTVQTEWPLPAFPSTSQSFLELSNYTDSLGNAGVQVTGTQTLLGDDWTLYYLAYTGSMPTNPSWLSMPLAATTANGTTTTTVNTLISPVLASATFVAYLTQEVGNNTFTYAQVTLTGITIVGAGTVAQGQASNIIPNGDSSNGPVAGVGGNLVYNAGSGNGYNGNPWVRSILNGRQGSNTITGLIPVNAGDTFYLSGFIKAITSNYVTGGIEIIGYNADGITPSNFVQATASPTISNPVNHLSSWSPGQWYSFGWNNTSGNPWYLGSGGCFTIPVVGQNGTTGQVAYIQLSVFNQYNTDDFYFANLELIKAHATATTTTPGIVKIGSGLAVASDGTISSTAGGYSSYTFIQSAAAAVWNVNHNLNRYPSVTVADIYGNIGYAQIQYIDKNNLTITFSGAMAGDAYCN